jgi:DNA replication protein DnaC
MRRIDEVLKKAGLAERLKPPEEGTADGAPVAAATDEDEGVCQMCGGAGFVRRPVPLGHADFGKAFPCSCTVNEQEENRRARLQRYSNLGPLTRLTFDNLSRRGRSSNIRDQELFEKCVDCALAFADNPDGWLVLVGPSGCGKTHLAAAIANRCLERGNAVLFVIVPDLLDRLRAAYHPDSESGFDSTFEQVRNAPVLILDDLGAQSTTEWAREKLFQIVNHRFNARLPTVVTTNLPLRRLDERLYTRLSDPSLGRVHELEARSRGHRDRRRLDMLDQPRFKNMTFNTFDTQGFHLPLAERRRLEDAHRFALEFAQAPEDWLLFTGVRGSGKTHLAAAITQYRRQVGDMPYFTGVAELLHFLRQGKERESLRSFLEQLDEIRDAPLLVLDDLDYRRPHPWWEELHQVLSYRHTRRLPTVITTSQTLANLSLDELGERLAGLLGDPSICSEVRLPGPAQPKGSPAEESAGGRRGTGSRRKGD